MRKILIAEDSHHREKLTKILNGNDYQITFCDSAFDAASKLRAYDFDLVISEVELPGDNAFELYEYIETNYPYLPVIMITDKHIDTFFDRIITRGIGNVLHKPVKKSELLNLTDKLISLENIFGLENYIHGITDMKKIRITRSEQIQKAISLTIDQIVQWGFNPANMTILNLMLNEMTINAVYHSHGFTEEKLQRKPVVLEEGKFVDLHFCRSDGSYAISITDYNGKLSKERILESISNVIKQNILIEKSFETGEDISELISESGRGIDLVRKLSAEYYFIIKKNYRTEIILIFKNSDTEINPEMSSLKIIEDRSTD